MPKTKIYISKPFSRFVAKNRIENSSLIKAISQIEQGLIDADLGGGILKQRVARRGEGKSGGYRTIIVFKLEHIAVFIHGFAKNSQANITAMELNVFRESARRVLAASEFELAKVVRNGTLLRVISDEKTIP